MAGNEQEEWKWFCSSDYNIVGHCSISIYKSIVRLSDVCLPNKSCVQDEKLRASRTSSESRSQVSKKKMNLFLHITIDECCNEKGEWVHRQTQFNLNFIECSDIARTLRYLETLTLRRNGKQFLIIFYIVIKNTGWALSSSSLLPFHKFHRMFLFFLPTPHMIWKKLIANYIIEQKEANCLRERRNKKREETFFDEDLDWFQVKHWGTFKKFSTAASERPCMFSSDLNYNHCWCCHWLSFLHSSNIHKNREYTYENVEQQRNKSWTSKKNCNLKP